MGVFNKTPYTNFHELNLNWIIKKIKEVAADNAYFKQFFKTIEDEHILGVVTKVTENNNNTVKTDYLNEDTQQMDDYTVYNKTGTDGAISGAVTPIANRVTSAEENITNILNTLPNTVGTGYCKLNGGTILMWGTITHGGGTNDILTLPTAVSGIDSIIATPVYTGGALTPVFIVPDIRDLTSIKMYVRDYANNNVTSKTLQYKWYAIAH